MPLFGLILKIATNLDCNGPYIVFAYPLDDLSPQETLSRFWKFPMQRVVLLDETVHRLCLLL